MYIISSSEHQGSLWSHLEQPRIKFGEIDFRPPRLWGAPKRPRDGLRLTLERQKSAIASPFEEVEVSVHVDQHQFSLVFTAYRRPDGRTSHAGVLTLEVCLRRLCVSSCGPLAHTGQAPSPHSPRIPIHQQTHRDWQAPLTLKSGRPAPPRIPAAACFRPSLAPARCARPALGTIYILFGIF